jgi:AbrB family looped-hinge helix DNA binding protein
MVRLGSNGRLVIPAELRKELGMSEGDVLLIRTVDGEVRISTPAAAITRAQELVRAHIPKDHSLADELLSERRAAAERE